MSQFWDNSNQFYRFSLALLLDFINFWLILLIFFYFGQFAHLVNVLVFCRLFDHLCRCFLTNLSNTSIWVNFIHFCRFSHICCFRQFGSIMSIISVESAFYVNLGQFCQLLTHLFGSILSIHCHKNMAV